MLTILHGDALSQLRTLEPESVQTCVTSPPYWGLRDYGVEGQLGLEKTPEEYLSRLVEIFREVKRVLRNDGTLWLNLGDSYAGGGNGGGGSFAKDGIRDPEPGTDKNVAARTGSRGVTIKSKRIPRGSGRWGDGNNFVANLKPKDLVGIPWMVAFALRAEGWYLRSDIIWSKPNPMPESVTDRPTRSHEYIFLLSKSKAYYYDADAIKEPAVADHGSGNGYKREARLSYGGRGSDAPYVIPKKKRGGAYSFARKTATEGKPGSPAQHRAEREDVDYNVMRNRRSVWTIATSPFPDAHFATFPTDLVTPCILAGSKAGDVVLDPFAGSGTTGKVAIELGRRAVLIEPKAEYVEMIERRCKTTIGLPL